MQSQQTDQSEPSLQPRGRPTSYLAALSTADAGEVACARAQWTRLSSHFEAEFVTSPKLGGQVLLAFEQDASKVRCLEGTTRQGCCSLVLLGNLHNRAELCAALGEQPEVEDCRLVLRAWERWRAGCVDHLLGDYAFFVFSADGQAFAACSPTITRPLFYSVREGRHVGFATHPLFLVRHDRPIRCDETFFAASFYIFTGNRTPFAEVKFLRPGHAVEITRGAIRDYRWWLPPASGSIRYRDRSDYPHHLRELLREATRCRIERSAHTAIALSAGIDSGSIAVSAAELMRHGQVSVPVSCISFGVPEVPRADESPIARQVAAELGLPHYIAPVPKPPSLTQLLAEAGRLAAPTGHLFLGTSHATIARQAARLGADLVLTGTAAEMFMADLGYLAGAVRARQWLPIVKSLGLICKAGPSLVALEVLFCLRNSEHGLRYPTKRPGMAWLRALPDPPELSPTVHPSIQTMDAMLTQSLSDLALLTPRHWHRAGIATAEPYTDARVLQYAYGIPVEERMPDERRVQKRLARTAFPEVRPELLRQGARVSLNEHMSASWIRTGESARVAQMIRDMPASLRSMFDVDQVIGELGYLRDPERCPPLFTLIPWALWSHSLQTLGLRLV